MASQLLPVLPTPKLLATNHLVLTTCHALTQAPTSHQVCRAWQLLPGLETHRAIEWLRARVARGALRSGQPYAYYLEALDEEYGGVRVGVHDGETNA